MSNEPELASVSVPALLRSARGVYSRAIRARWARIGLERMPRNSPFLLGGMGDAELPAAELLEGMGGSEASRERLVDHLLRRGLVQWGPDETLELTAAGQMASWAVADGIDEVTHELRRRVTPEQWSGFIVTLGTLCDMHESWDAYAASAGAARESGVQDSVK